MKVITELGADTGFDKAKPGDGRHFYEKSNPDNASQCKTLRALKCSIFKAPHIHGHNLLSDVLDNIDLSQVVVLVRDSGNHVKAIREKVPGNFIGHRGWNEKEVSHRLGRFIFSLTKQDIPFRTMLYPKFVDDWDYFWVMAKDLLPVGVTKEEFLSVCEKLVNPSLVTRD